LHHADSPAFVSFPELPLAATEATGVIVPADRSNGKLRTKFIGFHRPPSRL
jgi:hypothetical protein